VSIPPRIAQSIAEQPDTSIKTATKPEFGFRDSSGGVMFKKLTGSALLVLLTIAPLFSAAKFPFPQQATYPNGILPTGISFKHVQDVYDVWLKGYYEEQGDIARIKFDNPAQTVSEGIGYGMLIMVYMDNAINNTQAKFDKLWNYWKKFPSSGSLMHWKINGFSSVVESGSATDGDIDAALALALAYYQWGDEKYLTGAKAMMSAIKSGDVAGNVLDGGDQWNAINPSYMSMVATEVFQKIDPSGGWSGIQSGSYSSLKSSQNGSTGLWPNWSSGGVGNCTQCYGFDAARTPWRLGWAYAWYGHADAKTCCSKVVDWAKSKTGDSPGQIGQIYNLDGSINTAAGGNNDNIPTFLGPLVVAGMVDAKYQGWVNSGYTRLRSFGISDDNYYNECLELLTMLLLSGNMPDLSKAQPKTTAKLTVTVSPEGAGTVTVSPEGNSYARGDKVTLTATASDPAQYSFVSWGGDVDISTAAATVTMIGDMNIVATFKDNGAMDLVDDCEDGNAKTFLRSSWYTYNDSASGGRSTITPLTGAKTAFTMADGGYESEKAAKITWKLDKGGFSGNPYVGIGFMMKTNSSALDISASTGMLFYYKGTFGDTTCAVKIESNGVTESGASYSYFLKPSTSWKEVNITWDDFQQPKWVTKPANLDLSVVTKIQWQVQAGSGSSGELWLDEIHLLGFFIDRPIAICPRSFTRGAFLLDNISVGASGAIGYTVSRTGQVSLSLYDLTGRLVRNLVTGNQQAGTYHLPVISTGALSGGSYLIRLATPEGTSSGRLIVGR
jgi:endo-1,4-beta-D-glucanase Y